MTASEMGKMAPAPMPWMPRKRMRLSIDHDSPHSTDPIRKTLTPKSSIGRRP